MCRCSAFQSCCSYSTNDCEQEADNDVVVSDAAHGQPYVQTASVTAHLRNLARAVLMRRHPILLQVHFPRWQWICSRYACVSYLPCAVTSSRQSTLKQAAGASL